MQLSEVKIRFETGDLKACDVYRVPLGQSWSLHFMSSSSGNQSLDTQRGGLREFKTLDSAVALMTEIGFKKITVHI